MFERLTVRTLYGCKFKGLPPYVNKPDKNKLLSEVAARLAGYEDTGLTPERIRELQNAFNILFESERQKQRENEQLRAQVARMREALEQTKGFIKGIGCYCNYEGEYVSQCQPCFIVEQIDKALAAIDKIGGGINGWY